MDKEVVNHAFLRYYEAEISKTKYENSGLGLSLAKSIIEVHKGDITMESAVGKGTVVAITLPIFTPVLSKSDIKKDKK